MCLVSEQQSHSWFVQNVCPSCSMLCDMQLLPNALAKMEKQMQVHWFQARHACA